MEVAGDAAAVAFSWSEPGGARASWAQALILREGRIVHMQDFADPQKAFKAIGR